MVGYLIVLLFAVGCRGFGIPIWSEDCSYTREDVITCATRHVDLNPKDGYITASEIDTALSKWLPWYLKPVLWITDGNAVIKSCDFDKDGKISPDDFRRSTETCLPFKRSYCTCQYFCEKIEAESQK
jgi:hypothetical protein